MEPLIRRYAPSDAAATAAVFQDAIRMTASNYYSPAQIDAWATSHIDLEQWNRRRSAAWTVVAEVDGQVVGFSDLMTDGELDMLFVHPTLSGRGVARALVTTVLDEARRRGLARVTTHASRAARAAFERMGFHVVADNPHNLVRGVVVPNFVMAIDL